MFQPNWNIVTGEDLQCYISTVETLKHILCYCKERNGRLRIKLGKNDLMWSKEWNDLH